MIIELCHKDVTKEQAAQYVHDGMDDYYLDPEGWQVMLNLLDEYPCPDDSPEYTEYELRSWANYMLAGYLDKVCSCGDPISTAYGVHLSCPRHGGGWGA